MYGKDEKLMEAFKELLDQIAEDYEIAPKTKIDVGAKLFRLMLDLRIDSDKVTRIWLQAQ